MAYTSVYEDVIFIEGMYPNVNIKGTVSYKYGSFGSHLKTLNDVKKELVRQAKAKGCNCIIEFKYGQKASWISIDDMKFYGNGKCGILQEDQYNKIIQEKLNT